MRRIYAIGFGIGLALLLVAVGALFVLRRSGVGGYEVQGRVAGFSDDPRTLIVEHEEIPGYMPAMTMPLTAADSSELAGLEVGDAISFRLRTNAERAWITGVERVPDSAVARHPARASELPKGTPSDERGEQAVLQEGDRVPSFVLSQNQNGNPVRLSDYEGQTLVLTFMYTRCPIPDYCPLMSRNFAKLQEQLPADLQDEVELLSISFDPQNDTPQVLANYAQRYTDDFSNWTFATGTEAQVRRVTRLFGVFTEQQEGEVLHNLRTAVIGPEGHVRELWRGNDWKPEAVLEVVKRVAKETQEEPT